MTDPTLPGGAAVWREQLYTVGDQREFRGLLAEVPSSMGLTLDQVAIKAAEKGGLPLPKGTVATTLGRDKLPKAEFVQQLVRVCEVEEADQALWLQVWQAVADGRAPIGQPQDAVPPQDSPPEDEGGSGSGEDADSGAAAPRSWARLPGIVRDRLSRGVPRRWLVALTAAALVAPAVGGGVWWYSAHCGTTNPALRTVLGGECSGVTDGSDGHGVFGPGLQKALAAIDAENRVVMEEGGYVTVALMAPLTRSDKSLTSDRAAHQVEGAYIAQHEANKDKAYPKIRLVLANMGSNESNWPAVVEELKAMTGGDDRLVAVTGMGLSQQESIDAARSLSQAHIPMVGDVITADGFDKSGAIDRGAQIPGLVRVAPNVSTQIKALAQELGKRPEVKAGALVSAPETPDGHPDFYTQSMEAAFRNPQMGLLPYLEAGGLSFNFTVQQGAEGSSLGTIANNLCGTPKTDVVFYAGRATYLEMFIAKLHDRPCRTTPITVVTGSDAATVNFEIEGLNDPGAPISVLYVPLADPEQLADSANPDQTLYKDFATEFTTPHHGQEFDKTHLASGWAVMAHDALLTARLAIRNATGTSQTPPNVRAVADQLYLFDSLNVVTGAGGVFRIDPQSGNRKGDHDPKAVRKGTHRP
ncbi:ABC transporter substrate-binding protein [Streptomyces sp. NPDC056491]|uniref:ABC transporter substrate-binding protein n=1 Tax=Streptomyces sp. NPDC056491 TaxID=3345837 RepID=UPI0036CF3964